VIDRLGSALSDRYRIERELGAGGMATVYLAEDLRHKRKVALKVLKPEGTSHIGFRVVMPVQPWRNRASAAGAPRRPTSADSSSLR
jgi:serine/threonine protein kinase